MHITFNIEVILMMYGIVSDAWGLWSYFKAYVYNMQNICTVLLHMKTSPVNFYQVENS